MWCFYHAADLDGHCSGAVVKYKFPDCKMVPFNYNEPFPWSKVPPGEKVIMADLSLSPWDEMRRLAKRNRLIWIDHHKTAMEEARADEIIEGIFIEGKRELGKAACELCWEYFFASDPLPMPLTVTLLGRYDVWDHAFDGRVLPFQYGMRLKDTNPAHENAMLMWTTLFSERFHSRGYVGEITRQGETVQQYIENDFRRSCKSSAFSVEFHGLRFLAANRQGCGSKLFDSMINWKEYDAVMPFAWTASGHWYVSMYTERLDVDVSVIAKQYGGGGHAGAAGFTCDKLPFNLKARASE